MIDDRCGERRNRDSESEKEAPPAFAVVFLIVPLFRGAVEGAIGGLRRRPTDCRTGDRPRELRRKLALEVTAYSCCDISRHEAKGIRVGTRAECPVDPMRIAKGRPAHLVGEPPDLRAIKVAVRAPLFNRARERETRLLIPAREANEFIAVHIDADLARLGAPDVTIFNEHHDIAGVGPGERGVARKRAHQRGSIAIGDDRILPFARGLEQHTSHVSQHPA